MIVDGDNSVLGYASFGDWRPSDGFRHTVEHSVYVRSDQRGNGLGPQLMDVLIERAKGCDKYAEMSLPSKAAMPPIRLHERAGFVTTGQMPQVGTKPGRWLDLTFMQLTSILAPNRHPPARVMSDERRPAA